MHERLTLGLLGNRQSPPNSSSSHQESAGQDVAHGNAESGDMDGHWTCQGDTTDGCGDMAEESKFTGQIGERPSHCHRSQAVHTNTGEVGGGMLDSKVDTEDKVAGSGCSDTSLESAESVMSLMLQWWGDDSRSQWGMADCASSW